MPTKGELESALRNADAAGDTVAAKALANALKAGQFDAPVPAAPAAPETYSPIDDMGTGERFLAGVGKGMTDLAYGAGQLVGMVPQETIAEKARIDAPLAETAAGTAGEITGKVAAAIPAAFAPYAATVPGAAVIGTGLGLLEPVAEGDVLTGKATSGALGAAFGASGQKLGQTIGSMAQSRIASVLDDIASRRAQRSVMDEALMAGRDIGLVAEPTMANPTLINRTLEGLAGKISTAQRVAEKNQGVINAAARRELGLPENAPLTDDTFSAIRDTAGQAYEAVKQIGQPIRADKSYIDDLRGVVAANQRLAQDFPEMADPGLQDFANSLAKDQFSPENAIEVIKKLRFDAKTLFKSDDPAKQALARAYKKGAQSVEDLVARNLKQIGADDLYESFVDSRQLIAKTYSVEEAVNKGSGNVVASKLAKQLEKGKPISGELKDVARFAASFPRATQEIRSSMPGISPLDYALGFGTAAGTQNPAMMASLLARPAARELITSAPYQQMMGTPSYSPSLLTQSLGLLGTPRTATAGALLGPSIYTSE